MKHYQLAPLLLLLLLSSCSDDDRNKKAVDAAIQEEVDRRVNNYRKGRLQRCYEEAVREASTLADSILLIQARLSRDTAGKPPKPDRPERPELKTLNDSLLKIEPFLPQDSLRKLRRDSALQD